MRFIARDREGFIYAELFGVEYPNLAVVYGYDGEIVALIEHRCHRYAERSNILCSEL